VARLQNGSVRKQYYYDGAGNMVAEADTSGNGKQGYRQQVIGDRVILDFRLPIVDPSAAAQDGERKSNRFPISSFHFPLLRVSNFQFPISRGTARRDGSGKVYYYFQGRGEKVSGTFF
jgi:YD repeat-containing protein